MTQAHPTELEAAAQTPAPSADAVQGRFALDPRSSPRSLEERESLLKDLRFGGVFSDHMASAVWSAATGWTEKKLMPYEPVALDPSAVVLHYGQSVFEGLKAYRHADGSVYLFRPLFNAMRLVASARRLALPELPAEDFLGSIVDLVCQDRDYVPDAEGSSLYLRPFIFGDEAGLGVRPSATARYLCIASPSGAYFGGQLQPVRIWMTQTYHRAAPGGIGAAKTGGNYAASLLPQQEVYAAGYNQVCYLDSVENAYLEELGGMNVFVVCCDGTVQTPVLSGTILEGGTRACIIRLLQDAGHRVEETRINFEQLVDDISSGEVTEMFACGTAAVVSPIGMLGFEGGAAEMPEGRAVTEALYRQLSGIQYGRVPDPYGWLYRVL